MPALVSCRDYHYGAVGTVKSKWYKLKEEDVEIGFTNQQFGTFLVFKDTISFNFYLRSNFEFHDMDDITKVECNFLDVTATIFKLNNKLTNKTATYVYLPTTDRLKFFINKISSEKYFATMRFSLFSCASYG